MRINKKHSDTISRKLGMLVFVTFAALVVKILSVYGHVIQ